MPRRPFLVYAALALVAAALLGAWMLRPPRVPALTLEAAPLVRSLQFSARTATLSRVEVGSTLTGRVQQVLVAEGDAVEAGDLLLRLESDELRAALAQAEAGERQAAARLAGLRSSGRSAAAASLAQADSVAIAAQAELRRTQDLLERGFVSTARLDEARRGAEVAQAQQAGARALQAAIAEQGSDVAQAQAQLALSRAATAAAVARLAQAELRAPAAARVLARLVEPGQIVQPGRPLFNLALAGPLQIVAQVDERFLGQLQPGQTAAVLADAFPAQRFFAQVLSIAPLVDAQRGAVEVKFSVAQPPPFLREDMTLSVEVETARREQALAMPVQALRSTATDGSGTVWVAREGRVEARSVRLGLQTLQGVEALDGVAAGDLLLIGPAPEPGRRVRPDPRAWPPPAAARRAGADAGAALSNAMGR